MVLGLLVGGGIGILLTAIGLVLIGIRANAVSVTIGMMLTLADVPVLSAAT